MNEAHYQPGTTTAAQIPGLTKAYSPDYLLQPQDEA